VESQAYGLWCRWTNPFSATLAKLAGYIGFFVLVVFGGLLAFMTYDKLASTTFGFSPIAFVIVSNVIMNGIVLGCSGLVAPSTGHIHTEVIGRPLYLVRKQISPGDREP
jgi:hypothetical protein